MPDAIPIAARALAHRFGGYARRDQLLAAGLSRDAIRRRLRNGTFIAEFHGVYAIGHVPTRPEQRAWGAVLACGLRSALYGLSAAAAYGAIRAWPPVFSVITPENHRHAGIDIRRAPWLRASDVRIVAGVRVTSPALTALHVAAILPEKRLRRVINHLRLEHGLRLDQLRDVLARFPRHPGARPLDAVLRTSERNPTRSEKEDRWRPFALAHDMPSYVMNAPFRLADGTRLLADVYMEEPGVIIELDGGLHDLDVRADHDRDMVVLAEFGLLTIRVDPDEIARDPARQADKLHAAIDAIRRRRRAR